MRTLAAILSVCPLVPAQQPTLSGVAVAPLTCTVVTPSASSMQSAPAGALGPIGVVLAGIPSGALTGELHWQHWSTSTELSFWARQSSIIHSSAPPGSTVTADHDIRLSISPPASGAVWLDVALVVNGSPGVPLPSVQVDVGDDGVNEFTQAGSVPQPWLVPVGPAPQPIRVRLQSSMAVQGTLLVDLSVTARPAFIAIDPAIGSCMLSPPNGLTIVPTFDGIAVSSQQAQASAPVAVVFGLWPQPLVLPSSTGLPCLLLPRPDLVTVLWDQTPFSLPIPVGPWTTLLWSQGVKLGVSGWWTTEGYRVTVG